MNNNFNRPYTPGSGGGQGGGSSYGSRPFNPSGRPPFRGGGRRNKPNIPLNENIRAQTLKVIDEEGNNLGEISKEEALKRAQEVGLDLYVIVDKGDEVPLAKILDYGKYKYELSKKEKHQKKNSAGEFKEIKMHYNIGIGDYNTRVNQSKGFLAKAKNIKLNITLRGREMQHSELARKLAERFLEDLMNEGHCDGGVPSRMQGRSIILFVHPGPDKIRVKKAKEKKELEDAANDAELQNP